MNIFLTAIVSFLNPCWDWNKHTYATTKELKKKVFTVKSKNIKQTIGIQLNFILENKHQKEHIFNQNTVIFSKICVHFEPLLEWESAYVCHNLRTEKEGICSK